MKAFTESEIWLRRSFEEVCDIVCVDPNGTAQVLTYVPGLFGYKETTIPGVEFAVTLKAIEGRGANWAESYRSLFQAINKAAQPVDNDFSCRRLFLYNAKPGQPADLLKTDTPYEQLGMSSSKHDHANPNLVDIIYVTLDARSPEQAVIEPGAINHDSHLLAIADLSRA